MIHASEGLTHWYDRSGNPVYTVIGKNGKERPTTLRDARTEGYVPSVTGIIRLAAAPGLERWKTEQVLHACMTLPRLPEWSESDFIAAVYKDAQEQGKKAAERGTAIHAALQKGYSGDLPTEYVPHWQGAYKAINEWKISDSWRAERSFAHPLGFGGKVDLADINDYVIDFKTTEKPLDTIKTWPEHSWQLAAYREGLGMPTARCAIVYVSVTEPGEAKVIELDEDELKQGWGCFQALLQFWKCKNDIR